MAVWTKNVHKLIPSFGIRFSQRSSVDEIDVQRLNRLADVWWNEDGEMRLLHSMNKLRIKFIVNGLVNTGRITQKDYNKPEPLEGMKLLDVGCGGGILAEPLARLGANTTGLDAGKDLIDVAKVHAAKDPALAARLCYMHNTIEEHADHNKETYDAVVASEVIEHVADKKIFVDRCVATLKPGGSFFLTTPCKSFVSWFGGIILAEKILRLVPDGVHDWEKFIAPKELESLLDTYDCRTILVHGMRCNPLTGQWSWTKYAPLTYALHAVKKASTQAQS